MYCFNFTHKRLLREALFCVYYNIPIEVMFIEGNNQSNNHFTQAIQFSIYILFKL